MENRFESLQLLVSGAAHEMRTPLGVCQSSLSVVTERLEKTEQKFLEKSLSEEDALQAFRLNKRYLKIIEQNLKKAMDLTDQLKEFAFIDSDWVDQEVSESVASAIRPFQEELSGNDINVKVNIEQSPLSVNLPKATLEQIVSNFIKNSLMYGFAESSSGNITIDIDRGASWLSLVYTDDGCGIDDDIRPYIFEPFFTTGRNKGGAGLGLSIVYAIVVKSIAGSIELDTDHRTGCRFIVTLPLF
ncbi:sensor histidine kinase [Amphritea balenae]|uniref:histidine kinase n=1 Tax=Amphritea balenae TaxID=452629 RepID=A0A3P1SRV9_9GAMM|nr:HAMP domain-containing sensor histidine kinase [Amphritea balenae]RRC99918.1 sensor histidine kinase [Amphritea balenae]GGK75078.1 hypothetical protein GCM10007941_26430 [Amphritea balenae]